MSEYISDEHNKSESEIGHILLNPANKRRRFMLTFDCASLKSCTSKGARFIKFFPSQLNASFIALEKLCRFCCQENSFEFSGSQNLSILRRSSASRQVSFRKLTFNWYADLPQNSVLIFKSCSFKS